MEQGTSIYLASHSCDLKDTPNHDFCMPATHAYMSERSSAESTDIS